MITIRQTKDLDLILELHRASFGDSDPAVAHPKSTHWVCTVDGQPAGFASAYNYVDGASIASFLERVGVSPEFNGRGLQRRMIKVWCAWAKRSGAWCATTYTMLDNPRSYSNIQRSSFMLYDPAYRYVGNGVLYWMRVLLKSDTE